MSKLKKFFKHWSFKAVLIAVVIFCSYQYGYYQYKRYKYISGYLGKKDTKSFLRYVKMFDNDWQEEMARIRTESDFDKTVIGEAGEVDYYQILPLTYRSLIGIALKTVKDPKDKTEIGLFMGNLHYGGMRKLAGGDMWAATEIYNVGYKGFRSGKKHSAYLVRYAESLVFIEQEFKEFLF